MKKSYRLRRRGYSLVEVLVGMVVLMIAISSAYVLIINTTRVQAHNHRLTQAASLAEYKLEELRNLPYDEIVSAEAAEQVDSLNDNGGGYTRTWVVNDDTPAAGMKTVVVDVTWPEWETTGSFRLTGVVGE